jgi:hypothetical protein
MTMNVRINEYTSDDITPVGQILQQATPALDWQQRIEHCWLPLQPLLNRSEWR